MLNELRQGLVYNLEGQTGPVHAPIFTMTVEVCVIHSSNIQRKSHALAIKWAKMWFSCDFNFLFYVFVVVAKKVDGEKYVGQGRSKKLARIQAAEAALRNFIQFKDGMALSPVKTPTSMDFTSDDHIDGMKRVIYLAKFSLRFFFMFY